MLDQLGIDYVIDDDLVRGLDYYTGIIFEFMVEDKSYGKVQLLFLVVVDMITW